MSNYVTSLIRTAVPIAVGALAAWGIKHGFSIDQAKVDAWLIPTCTAAYYSVVRLLEAKIPGFGWLLGKPVAPVYPTIKP